MKKILLLFLALITLFPFCVNAKEEKILNLYLFYGEGCPHCKEEKEFLNEYLEGKDNIKLYTYEIWHNKENNKLLNEVGEVLQIEATGIPYLVIGNNVVQGYMEGTTDEKIKKYINHYLENDYTDVVGPVLGVTEKNENTTDTNKITDENYSVPILGKINAKNVSLPILAVIIGFVDGFNPCAMWILLFLISMLLGMKDRKKMWILGLAFLITSASVYFLFMLSWLNLAIFMNKITIIKIIIALVALVFGVINVIRYFKTKDVGCDVTNKDTRKKIMVKIKEILSNNKFILSVLGIMILAILVNIVELLCSLGLPVVFTEILSLNDLSKTSYIIYLLIYIIFFLLDDLVIFTLAMKTLKINAISNKYSKYSHLIGGIIMILIGLLMIFKPDWLMFNF